MKNQKPKIVVSEKDFRRLTQMLDSLPGKQQANLRALEDELDRAEIVATDALPHDVVRIDSIVTYEDIDSGRLSTVQLSYPKDADITQKKVSVLAPVGAALIGLKVGDVISWPMPDGRLGQLHVRRLIPEFEKNAG